MQVKYVDLPAQQKDIKKELLAAVERVFDHGMFVLGEEVKGFEKRFAEYCAVKYAVGVNSGTDAIMFSLKALGVESGDEVITPPNSFIATTAAIVAVGARPVFVDVKYRDMNIDETKVKKAITNKTKAIVPVHLTGMPFEVDAVRDICEERDLFMVEDCAQAVGARYKKKRVGTFGQANAFSFHPLKTLNACGDGGAITTNDEEIYETLIKMRNHGLRDRNHVDAFGYNDRLDAMQAAILRVKIDHLDKWNSMRRMNARMYNERLSGTVDIPIGPSQAESVYHTYVVKHAKRNELQRHLEKNGIETKIHYPVPIHRQDAWKRFVKKQGFFPVCEKLARTMLSIPVHHCLTKEQVEYVGEMAIEFLERGK